jgi:hypothetical protein
VRHRPLGVVSAQNTSRPVSWRCWQYWRVSALDWGLLLSQKTLTEPLPWLILTGKRRRVRAWPRPGGRAPPIGYTSSPRQMMPSGTHGRTLESEATAR